MSNDLHVNTNEQVHIEETQNLIASDKVEGTPVYNLQGERIGEVLNLMIEKERGTVEYAVMSFGGFLGIGERYHPLPWKALRYDREQGGYVIGLDKEKLNQAPSFGRGEDPIFDAAYAQNLYGFYGVTWSPVGFGGIHI